ncbi:MAG: sugar ABC transporter ATP-binding protein [Clostridiales bacterium]|nr:sugar ABC transporter ATP-binding protein [Clostridiales bacterium]
MGENNILLEMKDINKSFSGVHVLKGMNLTVKRGTVHTLMGENGAGKSTLMKILMGYQGSDSGTITFDGEPLDTTNIFTVLRQGISMIYQELNSLDNMLVYENVFCGKEMGKGIVDVASMCEETQKLLDQLEITTIKPKDKVENLSLAQKQLLEIAKAISYNSKLIIMDEPTSSIGEKDCEHLFELVRKLKASGMTFIYITHKMKEVRLIGDEITVMRDGQFVGSSPISEITDDQIIALMVGRELTDVYPPRTTPVGEKVKFKVTGLSSPHAFTDVSFDVKEGEIVGFAGLVGAGRTEVMETIFGYRHRSGGEIVVNGEPALIRRPKDAIRKNIAFLTEDRKKNGCFLNLSVYMNTLMVAWKTRGPVICEKECKKSCVEGLKSFDAKYAGIDQEMRYLSGGNQQKVLLTRWLIADPDIVILDEPTRGIDVGAKYEIYKEIRKMAAQGKAVIIVSSELPEILGICDRIVVMHEGDVTAIMDNDEKANQEKIMHYASGLSGN